MGIARSAPSALDVKGAAGSGAAPTASAAADAAEKHLPLVRDPIAVGVGQQHEIVGVGFVDQDALVERQDHARQQQTIREDCVPIELAVENSGHNGDLRSKKK